MNKINAANLLEKVLVYGEESITAVVDHIINR